MRYVKEILNKIKDKNATTVVGASIARPYSKARPHTKTILITLPIVLLLIALGITNAAGNNAEPETEQIFTEEGDGYYIWVRAVDHAGNKGPWSEAQRVWIETGLPTIIIKTNSNTTWAQTGSVTVALQDSKSGLAEGASVKYGWSESLDTAPSSYTDASLSYTAGTKEEVTFTASASGLTGKYYLWVVPTTLADTAGNTQTTTAKSTGQFYFDNQGPTAPAITGGSESWATSRTISVSTASTDANVGTIANYEYYRTNSTTAPNASTTATASLGAGTTSVTFNTNFTAYYVYFRAVDSLGNKGAWSSAQRLYIDINKPTVTANNSSVTITKGQSYTMSSYFTVAANGANTNITTTYKIGSTSYTNTSGLAVGTYTVTCTATKTGGNSESASMTLVVKSAVPTTRTLLTASSGTITIPDGVNVIEVYLWLQLNDSSEDSWGRLECELTNGSQRVWRQNFLQNRGTTQTVSYYVAVTPGKTLTVTWSQEGYNIVSTVKGIYYSQDINSKSPAYDLRY